MNNNQTNNQKKIFPAEFLNYSIENYTFRINSSSRVIYLILVISIFCFLLTIPFLEMDVYINATGIVNADKNRHLIHLPVSGRIIRSVLKENHEVHEGDTIIILDHELITEQETSKWKLIEQLENFSKDLKVLLQEMPEKNRNPITRRYQSELFEYQMTHEKLLGHYSATKRNYERQRKLFEENVISAKDFEIDELKYFQAKDEVELYTKQKNRQWQQEIVNYSYEIIELRNSIGKLQEEKSKYFIVSPLSGTFQNIHSIEQGQYIHAGSKIAEISPNSQLIATCWIPPSKIGLLTLGQQCSFRIDAFNFYDWGTLQGSVIEISDDAYMMENKSTLFLVKCALSADHLTLKNGFKGYLKKGMTLQSNFMVTRRTIFQLLYDKVDNWLNPSNQKFAYQ
jgi:membrane fusion protein, peptide pheromone/bacteriocin exporter